MHGISGWEFFNLTFSFFDMSFSVNDLCEGTPGLTISVLVIVGGLVLGILIMVSNLHTLN